MNKNESNYLLLGAPNVGKSTYFNKITWKVSAVGNVDRVTTTALKAKLRNNKNVQITDLPGVVSLGIFSDDERLTFESVFNDDYNCVINVVSATSLKRDLLLTIDLAEAGILGLININMVDELENVDINDIWLTSKFKVMVNQMSAKSNINVKQSLVPIHAGNIKKAPTLKINYPQKIEAIINQFSKYLPEHKNLSKRSIIIQALNENKIVLNWFKEQNIYNQFIQIKSKNKFTKQDIIAIQNAKAKFVDDIVKKIIVYKNKSEHKKELIHIPRSHVVMDKIFLNKYLSIPLFLIIIAAIWWLTFGSYAGGWIQEKFNEEGLERLKTIIVDSITNIKSGDIQQTWWANFVGDGLLGGVFTVISFLPWIFILSLCIGILEQVGILARVGIVFDRVFKRYGLSGRAIINIVTGVGCNVPSMTMAKNSNSWREKVTTIMISPFISCSARVVVYGFISKLFINPTWAWAFNYGITLFSMVMAILFGYFFSNVIFRETKNIFISELPRYHSPDLYVAFKKVIMECYDFVKRVILIVSVCNLIIWTLTYISVDKGYIDLTDSENVMLSHSIMRYISVPFQVLLFPLGIGESWELTISLVTAFPAKEIASSNIEILIPNLDQTINMFPQGKSSMLAFLTFFTFYIPCMASIATMVKEIGKKYTMINIGVGLAGAWITSFVVYNVSGLIESICKYGLSNRNMTLIMLLILFVLIYMLIYYLKQWKITNNSVWTNNHFKLHKIAYWTNTALLASTLISSDVVLLLN